MSNFKLQNSKQHKAYGEYHSKREGYDLFIDLDTGTKRRELLVGEEVNPQTPESIDLKITDYCDMSHICEFCHEASDESGRHAPLGDIRHILRRLEKGTEIAIGGGNPLVHPALEEIMSYATAKSLIPSITVNQLHVKKFRDTVDGLIHSDLCYGLGISYRGLPMDAPIYRNIRRYDHAVWHLILGVHTPKDLIDILSFNPKAKILLLGYKTSGMGQNYKDNTNGLIERRITQWKQEIHRWLEKDVHLCFDTLATKQLDLRRLFTDSQWVDLYMGSDGEFTMYIDAVKKVAKKSSFSENSGLGFHPDSPRFTISRYFKRIQQQ